MFKGILYNSSIAVKFLVTLFITLVIFLVMYVIGIIIVQLGFRVDIIHHPELLQDFTHPDMIKVLKFLQLVQSFGLFIFPPIVVAFLIYNSVVDFLRVNRISSLYIVLLTIIAILSFIPFSNLLSYINSYMRFPSFMQGIEDWMRNSENNANALTAQFLKANNLTTFLYNILLIAVIPAVGEELLFRGLLQRLFAEWTKSIHWAVWISAILFSIIHFQFFGFIPRLFLGVLFGYLLEITGTILIPIIGHFTNNLMGVVLAYCLPNAEIINDASSQLTLTSLFYGILGGLVGGICIWLIVRKTGRVL